MKQGDIYFRTLPWSGRKRFLQIIDQDPEGEYLLKIKYLDTDQETRLNKEVLLKKWKQAKPKDLQAAMMLDDRRDNVREYLKKNNGISL